MVLADRREASNLKKVEMVRGICNFKITDTNENIVWFKCLNYQKRKLYTCSKMQHSVSHVLNETTNKRKQFKREKNVIHSI